MADEDIANELEALSAIYEGDFENRPPLWNQPCFAINVKPNLESGGEIYCKCTLKFTLSKNYPKVIPKVDIESSEGLSGIDLKDLHNKIVEVTKLNIGEVMTHEVVSAVQDFLEARNLKPVTFYEAMLTREKRENDALQKLKSNSVGDHKTDKLALDSAAQLADEGVAPNSVEVESFGLNQDFIHLQSNKTNKKNKAKHSENDTKQPIDSAHKPPLVPSIAAPGAHVQTQSSAIELPSATMVADITKTITRKQPEHPTSGVKAWMQMFADQNEEEADGGSESDSDESVGGDHSAGHDSEDNAGAVIPSTETSRYKLEFAEISLLGSGASGEVWRAKNRLDQRTYAVKKINLNSRENSLNYHKIRREVTTISGLLHKYIVRYYAAWIEQQEMCESTAVKRGGSASSSISEEEDDSLLVSPAYFHSSKYDVLREIDEDASRRQLSNQSSPVRPAKKSVSSRSGGASTNSNKLVNPSEAFSFTFESSDSLFDYGDEAKPSYRAGGAAGGVLGGGITPTNTMRRNEISFINSLDLSNGLDTSTAVLDSLNLSHDSDSDRSSESSESSESGSDSGSSSSDSDESDSDASSSSDSYGSDEEENDGSDEEKKETHSDDDTLSVDQTVTRMSAGPKPPKTKKPKLCRFLFIQMEYCTSTLREKIDGGTLWKDHAHILKLLRQLLEALAYIHGRKVIHRDLKPANIFLDAEDNIKVGDFGLATNSSSENKGAGGRGLVTGEEAAGDLDEADGGHDGEGHSPVPPHRRRDKEQQDMSDDHSFRNNVSCMSDTLTGGIGTAMYSAPEQIFDASSAGNLKNKGNSSGNKPYNEKADLFSLGIILFEMCHKPFDTAMERFLTLTALRTKGQLPDDVSQIGTDTLRNIVVWLVQQDPHKRPSASELLSSPLISVRVDKDDLYLKEITAALWKPSSTAAAGIVSVLFDQKHNQFNAFGSSHGGAVSSGLNYSKLQLGAIDSSSTSLVPLKSSKDLIPESNENLFVQDQAMSYDLRVLQSSLKMLYPRAIQTPATQLSTKATHANLSSSTQKKTAASAAQNKSQSLDLIAVSLQYALALKNVCKYVLLSHGAVEFAPALLQLRSSSVLEMLAASHSSHFEHKSSGEKAGGHSAIAMSTAAQFLDPSGQVVVLPSDLISPYARQAAYLNIRTSQRFQIDRVYNAASSLAETLREGVLTTGEHPRYSEEAVYDVILPGDDQSKVLADVEVLTATVEYLSEIKHFLPEYAIRITDPRIMDCIIQLCAWPTNRSTVPLTGTGSESGKAKKLIDQVDREKLLRVVSLATDRAAHGEALALLHDLKLPKVFETRFLPFFKIITGQLETQRGESQDSAALKILELLEQEFERTDVIVGVQKQMAALDSPSTKRKTVAGAAEHAEISAKAIESEANKKKASQSKFPKPNSSQALVDLSKVGVKTAVTNKAQQGGKAATTLTAQPADRLQLGPGSSVVASNGLDLFDKKERKHIRILLKSFAEAVSHLRAVLTSLYALSHLQAQVLTESTSAEPTSKPRTNSNLSSLPAPQFNAAKYNRNRANSVDSDSGANPVHGKKGITRSTSNSSENALDCARGRAISAVLSCIVIDLGVDPRQKSRSGQSPFHHEGLHFVVEMFLSTSGGSHGGKVHKSTSEMTLASKSGDDISGAALSSSTAAANLSNILDAGGSSRRRHKGAGGIVAEGGQFDHLINAYRKYLYNVAGNKTVQSQASTGASITAVGVRFKLDVILAAVLKYEARQTKMQKNLHSAKANRNKTNTSTAELNPSCSTGNVDLQHLLSAGQSVDVLVVSTPHHTNTAVELSELYCPDVESVAPVVQLLRQHSICATSYVHQLQGFVPSAAYALCCKLGIAYLVLVDASHSVKTTTVVSVQHCVPNGTETDAAVVKVPLSKLPSYLHTHAQSAFGPQRVLSRAHPLLGDMASTFGAETRPSDDRMAESTSEKSRAEVSASNEKVSAKTAKADHPSSAHSAASSKHSSGADTRTFSLILLESEPLTTETNKDRRVVAQRKKDSDNIRARVLAHMHSMWNCCSVPLQSTSQQHQQAPAADCCNRIQVVSKVQGSKFTPGQIVCVEIPFNVLRTLNTIVMTRIGSSATAALTTMKHEFEALASSDLGKNHRKAMKQLIIELCSYTRYVNEVSASSASKNAGGNAPTATSAAIAATIQLYLYSIPDDRIDCINYSPQSLVNARIS